MGARSSRRNAGSRCDAVSVTKASRDFPLRLDHGKVSACNDGTVFMNVICPSYCLDRFMSPFVCRRSSISVPCKVRQPFARAQKR